MKCDYLYFQNITAPKQNSKVKSQTFTGNPVVETLKYTNIGSCLEGYIGKIRLKKALSGEDCYLNVFKKYIGYNAENYSIRNDANEIIGEVDLKINKFAPNSYDSIQFPEEPSHVFVDNLRNYSKPGTPYYKQGLEHIKHIGIRLLQIAQRRSDEAQCAGNIKLIAKNESKDWYKSIGMVEEFPVQPVYNTYIKFSVHNPNSLILPPLSKEPLSRMLGGL